MTRGQIAIIKKGFNGLEVLTSLEFNGDMYMPTKKWAGHGRTVTNLLKKVNDVASYHYAVAKFNVEHHHYNDDQLVYKTDVAALDFTRDYFGDWFSDYVYIKNITDQEIELKVFDKKDKPYTTKLGPNQIARLYFGQLKRITE